MLTDIGGGDERWEHGFGGECVGGVRRGGVRRGGVCRGGVFWLVGRDGGWGWEWCVYEIM
eukprot:350796-Amorphochlora_amoeboformis.AAC.1